MQKTFGQGLVYWENPIDGISLKKWFGDNRGLRIQKIVDESIDELRQELYETFGLSFSEE